MLHWCFSPPKMITEAVLHFAKFGATGVFVVPIWANSSFYSMFWPDGVHLAQFVTDWMMIQPYFVVGPLVSSSGMRCPVCTVKFVVQCALSSVQCSV